MSRPVDGAPFWPVWLLLGLAIGTFVGAGALNFPWPESLRDRSLWLGGDGVVPTIISSLTLVGVALAAIELRRSSRATSRNELRELRAEESDRFKTALEMLGSPHEIAQVSGVDMLQKLHARNSAEYGQAVSSGLAAYVTQASRPQYAAAHKAIAAHKPFDAPTTRAVRLAMTALEEMHDAKGTSIYLEEAYIGRVEADDDKLLSLIFHNAIAAQFRLRDCDLREVTHTFAMAHDLSYIADDLTDASISVNRKVDSPVRFVGCDLSNAKIDVEGTARIVNCKLDGASIVATSLDLRGCWIEGTKLPRLVTDPGQLPYLIRQATETSAFRRVGRHVSILSPPTLGDHKAISVLSKGP